MDLIMDDLAEMASSHSISTCAPTLGSGVPSQQTVQQIAVLTAGNRKQGLRRRFGIIDHWPF
jgi:hypothetical protein